MLVTFLSTVIIYCLLSDRLTRVQTLSLTLHHALVIEKDLFMGAVNRLVVPGTAQSVLKPGDRMDEREDGVRFYARVEILILYITSGTVFSQTFFCTRNPVVFKVH